MESLKERARILPMPEQARLCATIKCQRPLTKLGAPWNCWICLRCNKHPEQVNKFQKIQSDQSKRGEALDRRITMKDVERASAKAVSEALAAAGIPQPYTKPVSVVEETDNVKDEIAAGQTSPGKNDEYARGLTAKDMV